MKIKYTCSVCGSERVQLCFPIWVDANNIDDKQQWSMDAEAQPEKDSDKCWCTVCQDHVALNCVEEGKEKPCQQDSERNR